MQPTSTKPPAANELEQTADEILNALASQFPVCLSSDEFHFFPQARAPHPRWSEWDDFSASAIADLLQKIGTWNMALKKFESPNREADARLDAAMLRRILTTLAEQLAEVRFHQTQPTFYLTIAAIGLAEALEADREAFDQRIATLPRFLNRSTANLVRIPELFRDLGCQMTVKLRDWLQHLAGREKDRHACLAALADFQTHLDSIPTIPDFRLPPDVYERVAAKHIGCRTSLDHIREQLRDEIEETHGFLVKAAENHFQTQNWQKVIEDMPAPDLPPGGQADLYGNIISDLAGHCRSEKMIADPVVEACPVTVASVPDYLAPVRSAAAYSMPPGHPPTGGTFYISSFESADGPPRDYRLLTAHETFPGHHLLDASRWNMRHRIRRHIEFPIFYEGWASFGEEILFDTGFFGGLQDRLLIAKRRYWRAIRGTIDLDIQTGSRGLQSAAEFLTRAGLDRTQAEAMVKRYALKPGYQLCYTIGRRQFKRLYSRFTARGRSPADFVRSVLVQGEIGLDNLEKLIL